MDVVMDGGEIYVKNKKGNTHQAPKSEKTKNMLKNLLGDNFSFVRDAVI